MRPIPHIRIVAAAVLLILALLALPVLTTPSPSPASTTSQSSTLAPEAATPTATPVGPTPTLSAEQVSALQIAIGERTCSLSLAADQPLLTLGEGCDDIETRLHVPANVTLWLSLTVADQPDMWLPLRTVAGDADPPQLDARGRYFGCTRDQADEEVCQVTVEVNATPYRVTIPLMSVVE